MSYAPNEVVLVRCRVLHDYRGKGPHPVAGNIDYAGPDDVPDAPAPTDEVMVETIERNGRTHEERSRVFSVHVDHVVSVAEAKKALGGGP